MDERGTAPPYRDPTANVLQLVEAAVKRLDDVGEIRDEHSKELRKQEYNSIKELLSVQFRNLEMLRGAESNRIDATLKALDLATTTAAAQQQQTATVLAKEVASTAEALRALVTSTAASTAIQFDAVMARITDRINTVETTLSTRVTTLEQTRWQTQGRDTSNDADWSRIGFIVMAAIAVIGVALAVFHL